MEFSPSLLRKKFSREEFHRLRKWLDHYNSFPLKLLQHFVNLKDAMKLSFNAVLIYVTEEEDNKFAEMIGQKSQ